ncbi:hypothetical protein FXV91_08430 [Methanosarcina sp. DH2]|uniref:hypothetical protein n=1 Tax=Methanosarcina sp. DH2 TaxID=2605639 RepID=UPI001E53A5C9|nr:hypothetical protein [Methanosarcina sp. DH2]MCC4770220.1 hypothetical protein [Methanosarcina sp. DH2]
MVVKIHINLGTRKIQKCGYTHLLPLPAIWAKNFCLTQGSVMNIEMLDDSSLRITPVPTAHHDDGDNGSTTPSARNGGAGNGNIDLNR